MMSHGPFPEGMSETLYLITIVTAFVATGCNVVFLFLSYASLRSRHIPFFLGSIAGLFISFWFAAGYVLILADVPIDNDLYFRSMMSVLLCVYTGNAVMIWWFIESKKLYEKVRADVERMQYLKDKMLEMVEVGGGEINYDNDGEPDSAYNLS